MMLLKVEIEKLHYDYSKDILSKKELAAKISIIKGLHEKYNEEKKRREELEENLSSIKKFGYRNYLKRPFLSKL